MSWHRRMATVAIPLLAAPIIAAAAPKEGIVWMQAINHAFGLYLSSRDGKNERRLLAGSGSNYNPSFSADGRWIVFTSERYGSADVFRVHPDGSGLERLTDSPAFDDQGALSPDGWTLAFVSTRDGGTANIWLLDVARHRVGNLTRNKAGNFRPSWSPDGKWIAFSSDRDIPQLRYASHPNGAFAWELMQRTAIYIVHPDGTGLKRLTALDGSAASPEWSRDGHHVIFTQVLDVEAMRHWRGMRTQIVSVDIDTGARENYSDGKQYAWSPAYVGSTGIGYGINDPRDQQTSIVYSSGAKGPAGAEDPSWSPDGSMVVYDKQVPVTFHWTDVRPSRDPRYELISGRAFTLSSVLPFTRNGRQFLFVERTHNDLLNPLPLPFKGPSHELPPERLRFARWDGTLSPVIFDCGASNREIGSASLSADDQTIALELHDPRRPQEGPEIGVMRSDGSGFKIVVGHDRNSSAFPSLSPDGKRIVYRVRGAENGLRIKSLINANVFKLTSGWDDFPVWSPRGDRIAFTGFETGDFEIYTIRPDGTGLRQLTNTHGNDAHPVWSPDGRWIAFLSSRVGWKDEMVRPWHWAQSYGEIFVMRADGTDVRQLTDNQWEEGVIGWAPFAPGRAKAADPGLARMSNLNVRFLGARVFSAAPRTSAVHGFRGRSVPEFTGAAYQPAPLRNQSLEERKKKSATAMISTIVGHHTVSR